MRSLALLLASLLLGQSASSQAPTCYQVAYDSLDAGLSRSSLAFTLRLAPSVGKEGLVATLDTAPAWRLRAGGTYRPNANGDSLHLYLSNGEWELWFDLARQGARLTGWVRYEGDVQPSPLRRAHLVATPIPCGKP
jgi:hypothetical protein